MKKIFGITILIFALSCQIVFAKQEIIEASGSYIMDSTLDETPASATARAREEAKRAAIEKAGVYLQSYSKMVNLELDYDEVKTVAAQILQIQDEQKKIEPYQDNLLKFTVTIKALVDTNDEERLKTMMQDKNNLEEAAERYKKLQAEYDALKNQMEQLKKNYNSSNVAEIKKSVAQNNKYFDALLELEQGNNFYFQKNYQSAIQAYSRAINLNSNFAEAYNNRGNSFFQLQNYSQAVQDLQTAVNFNKFDARIHNNLGSAYLLQNLYDAAINEYTQAINLNQNIFTFYYNRALAYCYKNNFQAALPDVQRAMQLNPASVEAKNLYNQILGRLN